jgi:hypothetical protein
LAIKGKKKKAPPRNLTMATSCSYMVSTKLSLQGWTGGRRKELRKRTPFFISAQQQSDVKEADNVKAEEEKERPQNQQMNPKGTKPRPVEPQVLVKDKGMSRDYGGQWLSCATRHVRIYAAYIDPETSTFDQSQMDKLTLILDPTNEFVWNPDTCNLVYSYFQELVDHYEVVYLINHNQICNSFLCLSIVSQLLNLSII